MNIFRRLTCWLLGHQNLWMMGRVIGRKFRCKGCGAVYEVSESDIRVIRYSQKHGHFATQCPTCGAECFIAVTRWQAVRNFFRL